MTRKYRILFPDKILSWLFLVIATTVIYMVDSPYIISAWGIILLYLYIKSDDEAFWLAFFLVTVDGFLGFLGLYSVTLRIPGIPDVELAQFYILLSLIKVLRKNICTYVFYQKYLQVLLIYLIFLLIWGILMGFSGGIVNYLKIFKSTLPLILFYTIPRLFTNSEIYDKFFAYVFIILILGFCTQIFTLLTGVTTFTAQKLMETEVANQDTFRYFYNVGATLLGLFGALFYLATNKRRVFKPVYLYLVVASAYGMALISATRGWIIAFTYILFLTFFATSKVGTRRLIGMAVVFCLILFIGLSNDRIRHQLTYSQQRFFALNALEEGDLTAKGSLSRLTQRSPRVMKAWAENPVFGWGSSDVAKEYSDGHVGNQNLLLSSGILGFGLLIGFLLYYSAKLIAVYRNSNSFFEFRNSIPIIIIFLSGWFIIHSTSSQQFAFAGMPLAIITQSLFFSFGGFIYSEWKKTEI